MLKRCSLSLSLVYRNNPVESTIKKSLRNFSHTSLLNDKSKETKALAKHMPIYTRTGDKGTSALFTGERRAKDDLVFDCLGCTDELSSILGLAREYCVEDNNDLQIHLEKIQCNLQDVGSNIATPRTDTIHEKRIEVTQFDPEGQLVEELEQLIDKMDESLPPLTSFILPSGGKAASTLHLARAVCRRTERTVTPLVQRKEVDNSVGIYLNRLSDYLFTAARYAAKLSNQTETIYKSPLRKKKQLLSII